MPIRGAEAVFATASVRLTPLAGEARAQKAFAAQAIKKMGEALPADAEALFVGSAARDTGVRGEQDLDLFIAFSKHRSREEIVELARHAALRLHPDWEMHYAEHPYFQAVVNGFRVEVIPCYRISPDEPLSSAVDRTPLHALYLQKRLSKRQKRDVRLLKQLLKVAGAYGAEAEVQGFSGLVCEYLMLNYRSLDGLLAAAAKWSPPVLVDLENAYSGDEAALKAKFPSPLVIVDSVDRSRNAAAAVSEDSLARLVLLARAFAARPSESFFFPRPRASGAKALATVLARRFDLAVVEMRRPDGIVDDILVPQLRRSQKSLERQILAKGLRLFGSSSSCGKSSCWLLFELDGMAAPKVERRTGPYAWMGVDASKFASAHSKALRGPFVEGGRLVVELERSETLANLYSRARRDPSSFGVASHFVKPFSSSVMLSGKSVLKRAAANKELSSLLSSYALRRESFL